jgi:hypothetical protein
MQGFKSQSPNLLRTQADVHTSASTLKANFSIYETYKNQNLYIHLIFLIKMARCCWQIKLNYADFVDLDIVDIVLGSPLMIIVANSIIQLALQERLIFHVPSVHCRFLD